MRYWRHRVPYTDRSQIAVKLVLPGLESGIRQHIDSQIIKADPLCPVHAAVISISHRLEAIHGCQAHFFVVRLPLLQQQVGSRYPFNGSIVKFVSVHYFHDLAVFQKVHSTCIILDIKGAVPVVYRQAKIYCWHLLRYWTDVLLAFC